MKTTFRIVAITSVLAFCLYTIESLAEKKSAENESIQTKAAKKPTKTKPDTKKPTKTKPDTKEPTKTKPAEKNSIQTEAAKKSIETKPDTKEPTKTKPEEKNSIEKADIDTAAKNTPAETKTNTPAAQKKITKTEQPANCKNQIQIKVKGMVCDFCARSLEKVFKKQKGFAGIDVNLELGRVVLSLKPTANLPDQQVKKLIKDAGYNVSSIQRNCPDNTHS